MPKKHDPERFKAFDVMLPQGARARHAKAVRLMELAEAATHLAEMMAYRKMLGVD